MLKTWRDQYIVDVLTLNGHPPFAALDAVGFDGRAFDAARSTFSVRFGEQLTPQFQHPSHSPMMPQTVVAIK